LILEDDYDHEYHYRSQPLPPLAASDPESLVIYLSTFSKVLFPSARIGFIAIPKELYGPFRNFRRILTRQNDSLLQDAVARWMRQGGFERHLRRMRRTYEERRNCLVDCLPGADDESLCPGGIPDGGMALWMDTGRDSHIVAERAARRGVEVAPEVRFQMKPAIGRHLRLGFANQTPQEISAAMAILLEVLSSIKRLSSSNPG
jgi:GntR family transcriptional regulator / MocR family aminotransferase